MDFTILLASLDCPICLQPLRKREKSMSPNNASNDREVNESTETNNKKSNNYNDNNKSNSGCAIVSKSTAHQELVNNDTATRSTETANSTNSFQISWASDLLERQRNLLEACDAESNGSEEDDGIALLVCGHLLHYSCALQMYEYQVNNHIGYNREVSTCPVCRSSLNGTEDIIPFHPCQRVDHTYKHHINELYSNSSTLHNEENDELDDAEGKTLRVDESRHQTTIIVSQREINDTLENKSDSNNDTTVNIKNGDKQTKKRERSEETTDFRENKEKETDKRKMVAVEVTVEDVNNANDSRSESKISNDNSETENEQEHKNGHDNEDNNIELSVDKNNEDEEEENDDNEITLIGTRQRPYTEVYLEQLNRKSALISSRNTVLHDRERHLSHSLKELEEECNELNDSITAARLRAEILRKHGLMLSKKNENTANSDSNAQNSVVESNHNKNNNNNGNEIGSIEDYARKEGALDENKLRESASCFSPLVPSESELRKRKKFLRQMCVDTQRASQSATLQLANVLSESAHVRRQVDKYTYKLNKLSALLHHTRNVTDCN